MPEIIKVEIIKVAIIRVEIIKDGLTWIFQDARQLDMTLYEKASSHFPGKFCCY